MQDRLPPWKRFASSTPRVRSGRLITTASRRWRGVDLDHVLDLVRSKKYFVLHAPRQTGKTSALLALRDLLNGSTPWAGGASIC